MSIQVKFFGLIVDIVGATDLEFQNIDDTDSLRRKLLSDFQELCNYTFVIAVNKKIGNGNQILRSGDVVAILPPFAGG